MLVVPTVPYSQEEMGKIIALRVEEVRLSFVCSSLSHFNCRRASSWTPRRCRCDDAQSIDYSNFFAAVDFHVFQDVAALRAADDHGFAPARQAPQVRGAQHRTFLLHLTAPQQTAEVEDVKRCYGLFFDQARSQQYLDEYQALFAQELAAVDEEGDHLMRDAA
jgi:hypothetical protein